jgi:hypothetical protein
MAMGISLEEKDIDKIESKIKKLAEKITDKCKLKNHRLGKDDVKYLVELFDIELSHFSENITEEEYLNAISRRWWSFAD